MSNTPNDEKTTHEVEEIQHSMTVEPLPVSLAHDGGFVLDTKGLDDGVHVKLSKDGHTILIPQPTDIPHDPLNWSFTKKHITLLICGWATVTTDFTAAAGPAGVLQQGAQWGISANSANAPGSINILMIGLGPFIFVPMASIWGRAPVMFWTTLIGFFFVLGSTITNDFKTFFAMRALTGFFLSAGQIVGLAIIPEIFFLHERARKLGFVGLMFVTAPYIGPCLGNFLIARTGNWHNIFWMCVGVVGIQLVLLILFLDESFFDRSKHHDEHPQRPDTFGARMMRLTGIWQVANRDYFEEPKETVVRLAVLIGNPAFLLVAISYFLTFSWSIGINLTTAILFVTPQAAGGYGSSALGLGYLYFTPIVGAIIGEIFGNYFNDMLARRYVARHKGLFEPESRLYALYVAFVVMIVGLILVGISLEKHLHLAAVIFGWGMVAFSIMVNSVVVTAYSMDSYPKAPCDLNCWLGFARCVGGFSLGYYQQPWANKVGAITSFGTQAGIVGLAMLLIIFLHIKGQHLRTHAGKSE